MMRAATALCLSVLMLAGCEATTEAPRHHGYVEGEFLMLAPEEAGPLAALHVTQGETIMAGAPLFTMDATLFETARDHARARRAEAQAGLANLLAEQQRPEEIEVRLARKRRAEADRDLAAAELERVRQLFADGFVSQARLDTAQADYDRALAALAEIERDITTARLSARIQLIEQAQAAVEAADAALKEAQERLARRAISAPAAGLIQEVFFRPGEIVPAGRPVVSLLPPERRRIVFFVAEPARARFAPGTRLTVTCTACPPDLTASVDWLSASEEFTPPVLFSPEERASLVFRVEATPDQPLAMAPGQPVTIRMASEDTPS